MQLWASIFGRYDEAEWQSVLGVSLLVVSVPMGLHPSRREGALLSPSPASALVSGLDEVL